MALDFIRKRNLLQDGRDIEFYPFFTGLLLNIQPIIPQIPNYQSYPILAGRK